MQKGKEKEGSEALGKGEQKMTDNEIIKANDILDKLDFFDGQRAGRELWFEKPFDVQNEDIEDFSKDIAFLKDFINRQKAEIERLEKAIKVQDIMIEQQDYKLKTAKSEARKEFAERLKCGVPQETGVIRCADIDNLLAEMESERG